MRTIDFLRNNSIKEKHFPYYTDLVSENSFNLHLDLYRNYIKQTNNKTDDAELDTYNANAILLHETYFENIGKENVIYSEFMEMFFNNNFGSYDLWKESFSSLSTKVQSKGWVALVWDSITKKYKNVKFTSHDDGIPINFCCILLSDLYEHNIVCDYGINKSQYINKFFKCINWDVVQKRIESIENEIHFI